MLWLAYILIFLVGLAHTPLLVDLLRHLFPLWNIKRLTSNATSVLLVTIISLAFLLGLWMQLFLFIPLMPEVSLRSLKLVLHSLLAYWLWVNAATNYMYTVFSRPGMFWPVEDDITDISDCAGHPETDHVKSPSDDGGVFNEERTPVIGANCLSQYTHHCKICKAHIPYRDHHFPFTGNCIGLNNYSYFLLGLFYSMLGLAYGITVVFVYFRECFSLAWETSNIVEMTDTCVHFEPYGELVLPTIGAFVTVTLVFLFEVILLLADISTYDILKNGRNVSINLRRFQGKESRFRMMFRNQRTSYHWFLLPVRNRYFA